MVAGGLVAILVALLGVEGGNITTLQVLQCRAVQTRGSAVQSSAVHCIKEQCSADRCCEVQTCKVQLSVQEPGGRKTLKEEDRSVALLTALL